MQVTTLVKGALIALLATTAASANAANSVNATYTFDNVASGSTANSALGDDYSFMYFANVDTVGDTVGDGFHWEDFSSVPGYGDVLVQSDLNAVSGSNVLTNSAQTMALFFTSDNVNVNSFSLHLAGTNWGSKSVIFLDQTHHVIAGSETFADNTGLISITSPQNNVAGILITAGGNYDNLSIAAVPESDTYAMLLAGLGIMGLVARRRG